MSEYFLFGKKNIEKAPEEKDKYKLPIKEFIKDIKMMLTKDQKEKIFDLLLNHNKLKSYLEFKAP